MKVEQRMTKIASLDEKTYNKDGSEYLVTVGKYDNGRPGVRISIKGDFGWEPYANLSHNLELGDMPKEAYELSEDEIFVKKSLSETIHDHLQILGFSRTDITVGYGCFDAQAHVWRIN